MVRFGGHSADIPPKRCTVCRQPLSSSFPKGYGWGCRCDRCRHNIEAQLRQPGVCETCRLERLEDEFSRSYSGEGEL